MRKKLFAVVITFFFVIGSVMPIYGRPKNTTMSQPAYVEIICMPVVSSIFQPFGPGIGGVGPTETV